MTKIEFLVCLDEKLAGLSAEDRRQTLDYYGEIIDDSVEDGMSEEEAVASLGDVRAIVKRIFTEIPLIDLVKQKINPKRKMKTWEAVAIFAGFPVWLPLLISAVAVAFSLWITMYAVILSLYAVAAALAVGSIGAVVVAVINTFAGNVPEGMILISFGFIAAGLAPLLFFPLNKLTKLTFVLTKNIVYGIKKLFVK